MLKQAWGVSAKGFGGMSLFLLMLIVYFMVFLVLLLLCPGSAGADGRYLEIREVIIDAEILPDGSMQVFEERTYFFGGGRFRGADQDFPFGSSEYEDMQVSYEDVYIKEGDTYYQLVDTFPTEVPGTYAIKPYSDIFTLDYSFEAYNEEKTFTIHYVVKDVVILHDDVAELYYQFIGDQWDFTTQYARINLTLPPGAAEEEVLVWGHGPLHGEVTRHSPEHISWEITNLNPRRFLGGRVVFPLDLVPEGANKSGKPGLNTILEQEQKRADRANLERQLYAYLHTWQGYQWVPMPFILLFVIIYVIRTSRKVRAGANAYDGDYYRELPGEYEPAIAGYLVRKASTNPTDFTATIMDLARKKYVMIEEVIRERGRIIKRETTDYLVTRLDKRGGLNSYEEKLMNFLFINVAPGSTTLNKIKRKEYPGSGYPQPESVNDNDVLTFTDIKNYARKNKHLSHTFFRNWKWDIETLSKNQQFFKGSYNGLQFLGLFLGVLLFMAGFGLFFIEFFLLGGFLVFAGILKFILMIMTGLPFTEYGADQYAKWMAFKRFLKDFSSMDQSTIPSLVIWEHYLVYAVVMGVAEEVMKQLQVVFPDMEEQSRSMGLSWYTMGMMSSTGFARSLSSINNSFTTTMRDSYKAAHQSSSSSGSGSGGGFSSGGGGGFGGGGGSFR